MVARRCDMDSVGREHSVDAGCGQLAILELMTAAGRGSKLLTEDGATAVDGLVAGPYVGLSFSHG